jgi:murein DD-endopeptidase MepM/ murein hydrolase activator NlpD
MGRSNRWLTLLALAMAALRLLAVKAEGQQAPDRFLNVTQWAEGGRTHFYAENLTVGNVTATFEVKLKNMAGSTNFPYTVTLPGKQTVEIFSLAPIRKENAWKYDYTFACNLGSTAAVHAEDQIYQLPYAPGCSYKVVQGHHGSFSHTGSADEYAIDWKMPEGTPVFAARDGLVVKSKDDSGQGGPDRKFQQAANSILIQHDDGTIGIYAHLKKNGNKVKAGDRVKTGDVIGLSGNTGFSSGPHLHFAVFTVKNGAERQSIPVKFRTADSEAVIPVSGHVYMAPVNPITRIAAAEPRTGSAN